MCTGDEELTVPGRCANAGLYQLQLIMARCVWQLHVQPPVVIRNVGVLLAGLVLPALMAFLYSAWSDR